MTICTICEDDRPDRIDTYELEPVLTAITQYIDNYPSDIKFLYKIAYEAFVLRVYHEADLFNTTDIVRRIIAASKTL